jgi:hypothetical protein
MRCYLIAGIVGGNKMQQQAGHRHMPFVHGPLSAGDSRQSAQPQ